MTKLNVKDKIIIGYLYEIHGSGSDDEITTVTRLLSELWKYIGSVQRDLFYLEVVVPYYEDFLKGIEDRSDPVLQMTVGDYFIGIFKRYLADEGFTLEDFED